MTTKDTQDIPSFMFSGIIEAKESIVKVEELNQAIRIWVRRPPFFNDLKVGDSIAVDGVCLTLENHSISPQTDINSLDTLQFTLGFESLKVLQRSAREDWLSRVVNLERSLRFGDRVHGHLVTGHVENLGEVIESNAFGESWLLKIKIPKSVRNYCLPKGSISINGVSLTINEISSETLSVCLIPETQTRTNLTQLQIGDLVCLESDSMTKSVFEILKKMQEEKNV